jgi:hypothetical protein
VDTGTRRLFRAAILNRSAAEGHPLSRSRAGSAPFQPCEEYPSLKYLADAATVLFLASALLPSAPSAPASQGGAQKTQVAGVWIDPSTGLMWAGKDNGKDVNWKNAVKYCRDLRLSGHSDWRLASLQELEGIYDRDANAPGRAGPSGKGHAATYHVKGNLFLTGHQWCSSQRLDVRGLPSGYAPRFDFNVGRMFDGDEVTFHSNKRALCVRDSPK